MRIRLTRFIETATIRFRLQRTIKMPQPPQSGWFLHGYTKCSSVEIIVEKVGYNADDEKVECILRASKLEMADADARDYIARQYGPKWAVHEVYLTQEGLNAHLAKLDEEVSKLNRAS